MIPVYWFIGTVSMLPALHALRQKIEKAIPWGMAFVSKEWLSFEESVGKPAFDKMKTGYDDNKNSNRQNNRHSISSIFQLSLFFTFMGVPANIIVRN